MARRKDIEPGAEATLVERMDELAALYRLTDNLYRGTSSSEVYDAALDAIRDALGCDRASVLLFDEAGTLRFVAWRGLSDGYRRAVAGHSPWRPGQPSPQPIFVEDIEQMTEPEPVKAAIRAEGIQALGFIPLVAQGGVIGKFMIYRPRPHRFAPREIELAVTIARQLGFSLERARAEQARQAAEAELRRSEERFRLMLEHAPVMIWISDAAGKCAHLNGKLRAFWGVDEAAIADFDWQDTMHPDDAPGIFRIMADAMARRAPVTLSGRFRQANGEYRTFLTDAQPRFSALGEFQGMIGVNVDVTEREQADRALRQSETRFRLAVEAAPNGMIMTDGDGRIVLVNAFAEALFGYDRDELVGRPVELLVSEPLRSRHPALRALYAREPSARPMNVGRELHAVCKDGAEIPVEVRLSPIETPHGVMTLAAVVDISERRNADAQRDLLLAELNHRVKNTLAVVQAIAHQTFKDDTEPAQARRAFEARLLALSGAHSRLTQSNWQNASLAELVADVLDANMKNKSRVETSGPLILLPPKAALAVTMALHELLTNAVKYGALSGDAGTITVSWSVSPGLPARFVLLWREAGGPPVTPPTRRGFGSRLIERLLAQDMEGEVTLSFAPEGVVCSIDAPLPGSRGRRA
jgi:PAS domain S-box-containing protein